MKVLVFKRDDGGCGYYRALLPLKTAAAAGDFYIDVVDRGDNADKILKSIQWCDIALIPRISEPEMLQLVDWMHEQGKKVVLDWDDDFFSVSPLSEHYKHFGILPYRVENNGVTFDWEDGKNIDFRKNMERLVCGREALKRVDMVTVTTEVLANTFGQFNSNIRVLPNCLDMQRWQKLPLNREDGFIRMGWYGGHSHYEDWVIIQDAIRLVMEKHKNLKLVIFGQMFDGTLAGVDRSRIEYHPWEHVQAYPFKAAILDLDFSIIPLADTDFNHNKSPIKWIEQAALRVPTVCSYVSPYAEVMDLVPDNGLFIHNNTTDEWIAGINAMVNSLSLRLRLGEAAYKTVQENFDIKSQYHRWTTSYQEALAAAPRIPELVKPKPSFRGVSIA